VDACLFPISSWEELPECARKSTALYSSCIAGAISEGEYVEGLRKAGLADVEVRERLVYTAEQLAASHRVSYRTNRHLVAMVETRVRKSRGHRDAPSTRRER